MSAGSTLSGHGDPANPLVMRRLLAFALLAFAACQAPGQSVSLLDYQATVPSSWQTRTPSSSMRLAEYDVPGSANAEVVVYYFGAGQGGNAEANIARWTAQFSDPSGGSLTPRVTTLADTPFTTTVAEFEGSYARGIGMGPGRAEAEPDQGLVAAVVETPAGNLFVQLFGDRAAVASARDDFLAVVESIHDPSHP